MCPLFRGFIVSPAHCSMRSSIFVIEFLFKGNNVVWEIPVNNTWASSSLDLSRKLGGWADNSLLRDMVIVGSDTILCRFLFKMINVLHTTILTV